MNIFLQYDLTYELHFPSSVYPQVFHADERVHRGGRESARHCRGELRDGLVPLGHRRRRLPHVQKGTDLTDSVCTSVNVTQMVDECLLFMGLTFLSRF